MQIVIDINEEDFAIMKHNIAVNNPLCPLSEKEMVSKVANGTPLPDDAIIIDAKEQSDYVFVEKAKYNDLVEAASKALTDRIKKSLYEGGADDNEDIPIEYFESGGC